MPPAASQTATPIYTAPNIGMPHFSQIACSFDHIAASELMINTFCKKVRTIERCVIRHDARDWEQQLL